MATTSFSSLVLFIDTNLDTHLSFRINGDESIAELKGRIISEHANCFPAIGKISISAVKAKHGEFFYHLSDSMILNCFFQNIEGVKLFQVDIVRASSIIKSSNTDAHMHTRQLENLEHLNCKSGDRASAPFDAKTIGKAQFETSMKDSRDLKRRRIKKREVSSNEKIPLVDDSLQKINITPSENIPKETFTKETISNSNNKGSNSYKSEKLQLDSLIKDSSDLKQRRKKKKKVSSNEENPLLNNSSDLKCGRIKIREVSSNEKNPLVDDSLQKINGIPSENPPKEIFPKETISNCNDKGSNSYKSEKLQLDTLMKDSCDLKHSRKKKKKVSSNEEHPLVNNSSDLKHSGKKKKKVSSNEENPLVNNSSDLKHQRKKKKKASRDEQSPLVNNSSDLKLRRKKKISSNEENPLVNDSLQKINVAASGNPPKEVFLKEIICNNNDNGINSNKSEILASFNVHPYYNNLQPTESLAQATVDHKQKRCVKFAEVPSPQIKLVNSTLGDATAEASQVKEYSGGKLGYENVRLGIDSEIAVEHGDSSMGKADDASHKNQTKMDTDVHMEKKLPEANVDMNHNCVHEAPGQLDTDNSVKDPIDLKRKRKKKKKVSRSEELSRNPLVEDSLYKVNDTRADNQLKESIVEIAVEHGDSSMGKVDDASHKNQTKMDIDAHMEKKLPVTDEGMNRNCVHEAPGQLGTDNSVKDPTDLKRKRKKKKKVSRSEKLSPNPLVEDLLYRVNDTRADNQLKESIVETAVEHGDSSMGKVDDASHKNQTKMDIDAHMEKKQPVTDEDMNRNCIHEAPVQLDTDASMKNPTDLKRKRKKEKKAPRNEGLSRNPLVEDSLHKLNDTQADNQSKESTAKETIGNRSGFEIVSEIAASIKESEKNNGSGSSRHDPGKANSGSRTEDDSYVDLDNTKTSPGDCRRKPQTFLDFGSNATQNAGSIAERVVQRKRGQSKQRDASAAVICL